MKDFADELYHDLLEELALYADLGALPVTRLAGALKCINAALFKLKGYLKANPFRDRQQEITFFKDIKPLFISEYLYALHMFDLETNRPLTDNAAIRAFYEQELRIIEKIFDHNKILFRYYCSGSRVLDHVLFVRRAEPLAIALTFTAPVADDCSSFADHLFANFKALERIQEYLSISL